MERVKVSSLEGAELNAHVAKAEGYVHRGAIGEPYDPARKDEKYRFCRSDQNDWWDDPEGHWICGPCVGIPYHYSTEWDRGGPIIERENIYLMPENGAWRAMTHYTPGTGEGAYGGDVTENEQRGPTPLIAAMRCYVGSKFGDEVATGSSQDKSSR